jgi:NAD(P)H-hydrate epimerase
MAQADQAAMRSGISGLALMEAAGSAVANAVASYWSKRRVLVLCGPGNNGGDGFVAARHLQLAGWPVTLALLGSPETLTGDAAACAALWGDSIVPFSISLLDSADIVVDAIFGAGLSRPVEGIAAEIICAVAVRRIPVCAVDVPSGLDGATGQVHGLALPATITVTFFRKKPGHLLFPGRSLCGQLIVADIGIPPGVLVGISARTFENGPDLWLPAFPWPRLDAHKYQRGHVLVAAGPIMTGAARLSAMAAARIGAGLVTVAAPVSAWAVYAAALTSVMVQPLHTANDFAVLLSDPRKNAVVIGPGAGISADTKAYVLWALAERRATVLDADAISVFAADPSLLFDAIQGPCVLTPHAGEFSRLFSTSGSKLDQARQAAGLSGAVLVFKGPDTIIAAPDGRAIINSNAPPDLATGGTGDVLAGMIAGLMAQGMEAFDAAAAAVWLHGEAGGVAGPGLVSEDLPRVLPRVLRRLKRLMRQDDGDRHGT